jgi:hypothetical protein
VQEVCVWLGQMHMELREQLLGRPRLAVGQIPAACSSTVSRILGMWDYHASLSVTVGIRMLCDILPCMHKQPEHCIVVLSCFSFQDVWKGHE